MELAEIVYDPNPPCTHPPSSQYATYQSLTDGGNIVRAYCTCGELLSVRWQPAFADWRG